jgi:hypothetical protein
MTGPGATIVRRAVPKVAAAIGVTSAATGLPIATGRIAGTTGEAKIGVATVARAVGPEAAVHSKAPRRSRSKS